MKKICIIMHNRWEKIDGGISRFIREIAPRLSQKFQVTVIVTRSRHGVVINDLSATLKLVHLPDFCVPGTVIHIPGFSNAVKPYLRESDLVFIQTLENTYPLILTLRMKKPLVLYFHGLDWEIFARSMGLGKFSFILSYLVKLFWAFWYRRAQHICLPSPSYVRYLRETKVKTAYSWVPLGVDIQKFIPAKEKKNTQRKTRY